MKYELEVELIFEINECAETILNYVQENIKAIEIDEKYAKLTTPADIHSLLAFCFDESVIEEIRYPILDVIRHVFIGISQEYNNCNKFEDLINQEIFNGTQSITVKTVSFFDDPHNSLEDNGHPNQIIIDWELEYVPIK